MDLPSTPTAAHDTSVAATAPAVPSKLLTAPFVIVTLATLAYFSALGSLLPTLPKYVKDSLHGNGFVVGVVIGVFSLSAAVLRPWAGRLGDRRGRRILVVGGSLIVAVSVASYALIDNAGVLVVQRLLTGVGEAAVFVGLATAVQDMAPADRRGEAASYFSVALYLGLAIGPNTGERIAASHAVRAVLRFGSADAVPVSYDHGYHGVWLFAGGSALVAALLGMRVPVGETTTRRPETVLHRGALRPGIVLLLGIIPFAGFSAFLALYGKSIGIDDVGPVFAAYAVIVVLVRFFGARLPDRLGWRRASLVALAASTTAVVVLAAWPSIVGVYVATGIICIGQSLLFPALFAAVVEDAAEEERSHAVGTFSVFFDLANGVGAPILGVVVSLSNYRVAFLASAVIAGCGFLALASLRRNVDRRAAVAR